MVVEVEVVVVEFKLNSLFLDRHLQTKRGMKFKFGLVDAVW